MVDYRGSSYKRISRASKIRRSLESQRESQEQASRWDEVKQARRSSGVGGGSGGDSSSSSQPSSSSSSDVSTQVVQTTESVPSQRSVDVFQQKMSVKDFLSGKPATTQTVGVSPAFASKLAQQSLRDDGGSYRVQTELRNRQASGQSVDYTKQFDNDFVGPKYQEKPKGKLAKAYDESILSIPEKGTKYLFSTPESRVERDFLGNPIYSDNPATQKEIERRVAKEAEGKSAASELLIFSASVGTSEPVGLGKNKANVASKTTTKVVSTEQQSLATSVTYGEGYVERRLAGFKILPDKKVTFSGRSTQTAKETGFVGGVSKEPILKTAGESRFDVQVGKKKMLVTSSSEGLQVGELGQRKSVIVMSTPKAAKQTRVGTSVDTFVVKDKGDTFFGGVVGDRGVEVFGGKKIFDAESIMPGKFITKTSVRSQNLGIDIADPKGVGRFTDFSFVRKPNEGITFGRTNEKGVLGFYSPMKDKIVVDQVLIKKTGGGPDIFLKGKEINVVGHELGHAQRKLVGYTDDVYYTNKKESYAKIGFDDQIISPFDKTVPKEVKTEIFGGGRGPKLKEYYLSRGYSPSQVSYEVGADLFSSYRKNPALFAKNYPKSAEYYGSMLGRMDEFKAVVDAKKTPDVPVTTRIFEGDGVGQPQIPVSAFGTKKEAVSVLRKEVEGRSSINAVPVFKQANPSGGQFTKTRTSSFSFDGMVLDSQVKTALESRPVFKIRIGSPAPDSLITETKRESKNVNVASPSTALTGVSRLKPRLVYADDGLDVVPKSNLVNKSNVREYASVKSLGVLGVGSLSGSRSGSGLRSDSIPRQSVVPRSEALPRIMPISGQRPASVSKVGQVNPPTYSYRPVSVLRPSVSVVPTPMIVPVVGFGFKPRGNSGRFSVELRRFGKFQKVGYGKSLAEANRLGASYAKKTLGATYRIKSNTGLVKASPSVGFYGKGFNIIERNKYRLNTGSELGEIGFFKKKRGRGLRVYE